MLIQIFTEYEANIGKITQCCITWGHDEWKRLNLLQAEPDGIYITSMFTTTFTITLDIMQSHTSKGKPISSTSHTSVKHTSATIIPDNPDAGRAPNWMGRQRSHQKVHSPQAMFPNPLDSSSSDAKSFDEDDMYGSDSGVETISLASGSKGKVQSPDENKVYAWASYTHFSHLTFEAEV